MKKILLTGLFALSTLFLFSQACTICTPDPNIFPPNPADVDFALSSDSLVITQGQVLDTTIHALMPKKFVVAGITVTVSDITILGVSGMPNGLNWTCDNYPSCSYDPATYRYGCFQLCGVTFTTPGDYYAVVSVMGSAAGQSQSISFDLPITVLGASGGNLGFSFNPTSGCDPVDVDFTANITSQNVMEPIENDWDLDNGTIISGENVSTIYTPAGDYYPSLDVSFYEFQISDVSVTANSVGDWWCGDVEEPTCGTFGEKPDVYFTLNSGGNTYSSAPVGNTTSPSWSGIDEKVTNQAISIQFFDNDDISNNDNGGLASIFFNPANMVGNSQNLFINTSGVSGSLTIKKVKIDSLNYVDTLEVFPNPAVPLITNLGADSICIDDSVMLTVGAFESYLWYFNDTSLIFGADSNTLWVKKTGTYKVVVTDTITQCRTMSTNYSIAVLVYPPIPIISYNAVTDVLEVSNPGSFQIQWYLDGNPIAGANNPTLTNASTISAGPFTVVLFNAAGCETESGVVDLCFAGEAEFAETVDTLGCCDGYTNRVEINANNFILSTGATVAWALSPEAAGPITSEAEILAANNIGRLLLGNTTTSIDYTVCGFSAGEGNYYITPVIIEDPGVVPVIYDTLIGCKPFAEFCPDVNMDTTAAWEISTFGMSFPDGSSINVIQAIGENFNIPGLAVLNPGLIALVGGSIPCIALTSLFKGNPNGQWTMNLTNTGAGQLTIVVPPFNVIVESDTCPLLTSDQIVPINGFTMILNTGESDTVYINIPPVPDNFPNVLSSCQGYGTPVSFYFKDCEIGIDETNVINNISLYPNPNNGVFALEYNLVKQEDVSIKWYTIAGKEVFRKEVEMSNVGLNKIQINNSEVSPGIYLIEIQSETQKGITKVVIN